MQKRVSGISRYVGFMPPQEKSVHDHFRQLFLNAEPLKAIASLVRAKTPQELLAVEGILKKMPDFIAEWGGVSIPITEKHIHFIAPDRIPDTMKESLRGKGAYVFAAEMIYVIDAGDLLENMQTIVHELIHFYSFQSVTSARADGEAFKIRRVGFEMDIRLGISAFHGINEAITVELQKEFDTRYFIEIMPHAIRRRNDVRRRAGGNADDYALIKVGEKIGDEVTYNLQRYPYVRPRETLARVIQGIYEACGGRVSGQEIFALFARAAMSGRLLPVARLVEKAFGKGSFRELGLGTKA